MSNRIRIACLLSFLILTGSAAGEDEIKYFEQNVRPLLAARCFSCHGEKKQESDLRLDNRAFILAGGASGDAAAVPGDVRSSLLLQYVRREVDGMEMPPEEPLTPGEIKVLEHWVERGLAWPSDSRPVVATMEARFERDRKSHWAFQSPTIETVDRTSWPAELRHWPQTGLDEFVLDRLLKADMTPSPPADRRTLFRRAKFDVLGLPPTIAEVTSFQNDQRPNAWVNAVDTMLASPHYGERWGRHWLDVARYADTRGYTFGGADRNYQWAYTYRDYVVGAWNDDLPYDQFVRQQLAADQLELGNDNRALAALGFLTVGRKFNNSHDDVDDKIDAVTRGFVGLTVACARCHDHKYDAIPTEDYYSLYGVFNSSHEPGDLPIIGDAPTLANSRRYENRFSTVNRELASFENQLVDELSQHVQARITDYLVAAVRPQAVDNDSLRPKLIDAWRRLLKFKAKDDEPTLMPFYRLRDTSQDEFADAARQLAEELATESGEFLNPFVREAFTSSPPASREAMARLYGRVLSDALDKWKQAGGNASARSKQPPEVRQLLWYFSDGNSPGKIEKGDLDRYMTDEEKGTRSSLKSDVDFVRETKPTSFRRAMVMYDRSSPSDAHVFIRGSSGRPGKKVPRQSPLLVAASNRKPVEAGSGRLELANDIASPRNPLTARVIANRVWMHHFGRPLVDTPSDFGIRCEEPLHRPLLDYLAVRLMQSGWSIKSLHREILLSATWRQASGDRPACYAVDPENHFLWRANRRRLEFEATRDALLFVAGSLDTTFGGSSVRMYRKPEEARRRSVYGYIDRQDLPNLLRVFDFAGPDQSVAKRADTTVPQQALFMMNSPFVAQHASQLADAGSQLSDEEFVDFLYGRLFARPAVPAERTIAESFLASSHGKASPRKTVGDDASVSKNNTENDVTGKQLDLREQLAQLLLLTNEFIHVD